MAKFYGVIGYAIQVETVPGVWEDQIIERNYRGDVLQNMNRWQSSETHLPMKTFNTSSISDGWGQTGKLLK